MEQISRLCWQEVSCSLGFSILCCWGGGNEGGCLRRPLDNSIAEFSRRWQRWLCSLLRMCPFTCLWVESLHQIMQVPFYEYIGLVSILLGVGERCVYT